MYKLARVFVFSALLIGVADLSAKTPDGKTPSEETVCDNERGAAFGLCNAYCEAMDCTDPKQRASNKACSAVKRNFEKKTGRPMPCEISCPCPRLLQLFADIISGAVTVQQCTSYADLLYVATTAGDYAIVGDGPPPSCNVNGEPPFVELSETERLVCRIALRRAVKVQGVVCVMPE